MAASRAPQVKFDMAKMKASVLRRSDDKKKKTKKEKIGMEDEKGSSSDSEDDIFSKEEKDSGMTDFIKGTTWPTDTSIEVVVKYDAAKEIRSVKKELYPLLYHMTRSDPRQMAACICRLKLLLSHVKTRFEASERKRGKAKISSYEMRNLGINDSGTSESASPKKSRRAAVAPKLDLPISDLTDAKTELLKILARVTLKRPEFAKLLTWMQKLKLCGKEGEGRWGEVYVKDTTLLSADDDNEEIRTASRTRSEGKSRKALQNSKLRTCVGNSNQTKNRWSVALRNINIKGASRKSSESMSEESCTEDSKMSSVPKVKTLKLNKFKLKGKTLCIKGSKDSKNVDVNNDEMYKCSVPLVDVVSVLDTRIDKKNKAKQAKTNPLFSRRSRRRENQAQKDNGDDSTPKRLCISQSDVDMYQVYNDDMRVSPIVEIDNMEDGTCVPYSERFTKHESSLNYEDRFLTKEEEVFKRQFTDTLPDFQENNINNATLSSGHQSVSLTSETISSKPLSSLHSTIVQLLASKYPTRPINSNQTDLGMDGGAVGDEGLSCGVKASNIDPDRSNPSPILGSVYPLKDTIRKVGGIDKTTESVSPNSSSSTENRLSQIKTEDNITDRNSLIEPGHLFDGITVNLKKIPSTSNIHVGISSKSNEPTSSTDKNVKEEPMDFMIFNNTECIVLDGDDDEEVNENGRKTEQIDTQKEADPIIVIDD